MSFGWVPSTSPDTFSGVCGGRYLFCSELRVLVHRSFPTNHHHDLRLQYVLRCGSLTAIYIAPSLANAFAQLLTIPPYVVSTTILCSCAYASDKLQSRGKFVMATAALAATGYVYVASITASLRAEHSLFNLLRLLLAVPSNNHVRYFATFCITSGTYGMICMTLAWCMCRLFSLGAFALTSWNSHAESRIRNEEGDSHAALPGDRAVRVYTRLARLSVDGGTAISVSAGSVPVVVLF